MINLGDPIWVTIIGNEGAPPEQAGYHGYRFTWPAGVPAPVGPDTILISGIELYGYPRLVGQEWQWVLQVLPDPTTIAVDAIPGPDGWDSPVGRQVWLDTAFYLLQAGVTGSVLYPGLTNLFNAARTELLAQGWTAP